jgi:AcrR family transcriptional regulator
MRKIIIKTPVQSEFVSPWDQERQQKTERDEKKKSAIFSVAALAFAKRGYHETSMDEIAHILGITKPTLYKYFKNKKELLSACQLEAIERFIPACQNAKDHVGTSIDKLKVYFQYSIDFTTSDIGRALYEIEMANMDSKTKSAYKKGRKKVDHMIREIIEEGIDNGEIDPLIEPRMVALALFGAFNFIPRWYQFGGEHTSQEIGDQYFKIFFDGIRKK